MLRMYILIIFKNLDNIGFSRKTRRDNYHLFDSAHKRKETL